MKKRFLCLALVLVMLVGIIPFSAVTAFAAEPQSENTPVTYSGDVVNVTTWEELKAALEAEGTATVVVKKDITKTISFAAEKGDASDWNAKVDEHLINQKGHKTLVLEKNVDIAVTELFLDNGKMFRGIIYTIGGEYGSLTVEGPGSFLGSANARYYKDPFDGEDNADKDYFSPVVIDNRGNLTINGGTIGGKDTKDNLFGAIANSYGDTVINGGVVQGVANYSLSNDVSYYFYMTYADYASFAVLSGQKYTINGGEIKSITAENCFNWMRWFGGYVEDAYDDTPNYERYFDKGGAEYGFYSRHIPGTVLSASMHINDENTHYTYITVNGGKFTSNQKYCKAFGVDKNYNAGDWASAGKYSSNKYTSRLYAEVIEKMPLIMAEGTSLTFNADYNEFTVHPTTTKATVNGKACADGETVKVPLLSNSVPVTFTWNGLDESLEDCTLIPSIRAYINGTQFGVSYTPEKNPDGTYSVTFSPGIGYEGQTMKYVLDLYVALPNKCQVVIDSLEVNFAVGNDIVDTANVTVDTPVAGKTPAETKGTINKNGLTINKETWYEVKGSSLRPMASDEQFVEGKQYKYDVFVSTEDGYRLASDFYLTINEKAASGNGESWKSRSFTAKAVLSAKAQNDVTSATVKYNDYAQFVVDVNGGSGSPTYTWTKSEGAPDIVAGGADYQHHIDVQGTKNGTFTYTCVVTDGAETQTVTFTLIVQEQVTYYAAAPDVNGLVGTGNKDVDLLVGESVTLIPDYVLIENNYEVSGSNLTPRKGTISISWWIFTLDDSKGVHITADQLVVDDDVADYLNTSKTGRYYVQIEITNYVDDSEYGSATRHSDLLIIDVVEPEATGTVKGSIEKGEEATPFAMRKMSARSAENFEGTIVYLVKDENVVYVTEADAQGYYTFTNVLYGSYNVKVEKEGYEDYNKPVEVNAEEVTHDVTIIIHECFKEEGMTMYMSAMQPICSDVTEGTLGNIEYRGCIACGKFYDMEGNLIADSANDPGSVNEMGVPYKAIIYPMHDYCGEAQEGGDADRYLRHRAETCLENTTYWHYCIYCHKSAGDDPSAVDKYYVGSASNQTHSYTLEIADYNYFYQGGETCKDKIWYYHACEYCYEKSPSSVWESSYYGAHAYGTLIPAQGEVHTPNELKAGVAAHYFCDVCDTYFDEEYIETTLAMLTGAVPTHSYTNVNGYKGADGHANTCSCGAKDTVVKHTPNMENPTETEDKKCTVCDYIIENKTGHIHTSHLTKVSANSASCTVDGNIEYYTCSCGKWFTDATATTEITNKDSVKLPAGHTYGDIIPLDNGTHTATELKDGMKAHFFCDVCDTYFDSGKNATTKAALTITNAHSYTNVNGYKGADGHANTCSCGAKDTVEGHTPDRTAATETQPIKCTKCQYVIAAELGHVHTNHLTKVSANSASCTADGNIEYYTCSCGKWFTDATATTEITNKDSVVIKAAHNFGNLIPAQDAVHTATELKGAVAAHYHCSACGKYFTEGKVETTLEALTGTTPSHSYGDWKTDADKHWKECSCGKKADEGNHVDANSNNKCDTCDKTLSGGVTPPPHTHDYGTTWKFDGTNHWKECSCGDKKEVTAHSGGTATCEAKAKCSECNTEYGELAEHKYSEATCTAKAKCSVCGDEKGELAAHTYVDGKCACGATDPNYTPGTDTPGTDEPGTDTPGTDDPNTGNTDEPKDDEGGCGSSVGGGSVLVVGVGGFALVWFLIKKKTWAEFLAIFKKG